MALTAANGALLTLAGLTIVGLTMAHPTYLFRFPTRSDGLAVAASVVAFVLATIMMPAWHKDVNTAVANTSSAAAPAHVAMQPASNTTTQARALKAAPAPVQLETFATYWRENFGKPGLPVFLDGRVTRFEVLAHRQLVAYTNLAPDADGQQVATAICGAMAGYVFSDANAVGLDSVWVWGSEDSLLAKRKDAGEPC